MRRQAALRGAASAGEPAAAATSAVVGAGSASTLEVGAGRFDPREASRLAGGVEVAELEPVAT